MQVFLETDRLVLRRFTMADADNLVSLDADPDVMRFVTGGIPTSREEIQNEVLPAFLGYYQRYEGYGFWAAIEKETGEFLGWFHFRPHENGDRKSTRLNSSHSQISYAVFCLKKKKNIIARHLLEQLAIHDALPCDP